MIVLRIALGEPIRWQCSVCGDEGVVSNWEDSPFDLRRRRPALAGAVSQISSPDPGSLVIDGRRSRAASAV